MLLEGMRKRLSAGTGFIEPCRRPRAGAGFTRSSTTAFDAAELGLVDLAQRVPEFLEAFECVGAFRLNCDWTPSLSGICNPANFSYTERT
jgi:hypothetical protein